jgi:hypothetical protein
MPIISVDVIVAVVVFVTKGQPLVVHVSLWCVRGFVRTILDTHPRFIIVSAVHRPQDRRIVVWGGRPFVNLHVLLLACFWPRSIGINVKHCRVSGAFIGNLLLNPNNNVHTTTHNTL